MIRSDDDQHNAFTVCDNSNRNCDRIAYARDFLAAFSSYGTVTIALFLNGTPFSINVFWSDQQFRQAMILRFMTNEG